MIRALFAFLFLFLPLQAHAQQVTILAFGDSLTAGLGLNAEDAFPAKLEAALKAKGLDVRIINAGISGDTASAGRDRLDWALTPDVKAVIVELGANDALRGQPPADTRKALDDILGTLATRKIPTLLAGMMAPRNLGPDYAAAYDPLFGEIAKAHGALFYPFFLDGVAADTSLNQADGMHPNPKGVDVIVSRILPLAEQLVALAQK